MRMSNSFEERASKAQNVYRAFPPQRHRTSLGRHDQIPIRPHRIIFAMPVCRARDFLVGRHKTDSSVRWICHGQSRRQPMIRLFLSWRPSSITCRNRSELIINAESVAWHIQSGRRVEKTAANGPTPVPSAGSGSSSRISAARSRVRKRFRGTCRKCQDCISYWLSERPNKYSIDM